MMAWIDNKVKDRQERYRKKFKEFGKKTITIRIDQTLLETLEELRPDLSRAKAIETAVKSYIELLLSQTVKERIKKTPEPNEPTREKVELLSNPYGDASPLCLDDIDGLSDKINTLRNKPDQWKALIWNVIDGIMSGSIPTESEYQSYRGVDRWLNENGILTLKGGQWQGGKMVKRIYTNKR